MILKWIVSYRFEKYDVLNHLRLAQGVSGKRVSGKRVSGKRMSGD